MEDIQITVRSQEEADQLHEDFEEVVARVNGDLMTQTMTCGDPLSVEMAIVQAEQCIDRHLSVFADNANLQQLGPQIKAQFAASIRKQAETALSTSGISS